MFAIGALWWLLSIALIIELLWTVDKCRPVLATISFLVYLAILQWFFHVPIFSTIAGHPLITLGLILTYVIIGICWSFVRWWLFIKQIFTGKRSLPNCYPRTLAEIKAHWLSDRKFEAHVETTRLERTSQGGIPSDTPLEVNGQLQPWLKDLWLEHLKEIRPKAVDNKKLICVWIFYWPFSALWSLIEDLIHEVIICMITRLKNFYEAIGNAAMKDFK